MRRKPNIDKTQKANSESLKATKRVQEIAEYQVVDNDVLILNGPYNGAYVRELWTREAIERDWIINKLWILNDKRVNEIIRTLICE
jgi:hypothetical protein